MGKMLFLSLLTALMVLLSALPGLAEDADRRPLKCKVEVKIDSKNGGLLTVSAIIESEEGQPTPVKADEVPELVKKITDADIKVRSAAAARLVATGAPAVKPLVDALKTADSDMRDRIALLLALIGTDEAIKALRTLPLESYIRYATSEGDTQRYNAIFILTAINSDAAVKTVHSLMQEGQDETLRQIIFFGIMKFKLSRYLPEVVSVLQDEDEAMRAFAALAITQIDPKYAADRLLALLPDDNPIVRVAVIGGLYQLKDRRLPDILLTILRCDQNPLASMLAVSMLSERKEARAVPHLLAALAERTDDEWEFIRVIIASSLDEFTPTPEIQNALRSAAQQDSSEKVRTTAAETLAKIEQKK